MASFFAKRFRLSSTIDIHICNIELDDVFEYSKLLMEDINPILILVMKSLKNYNYKVVVYLNIDVLTKF